MAIKSLRLKNLIPLVIFVILAIFLYIGLSKDPKKIPSPLINKSMPQFQLSTVSNSKKIISNKDLLGKVALVNVWATWCITCRVEHPFLMDISRTGIVPIYGLDYKDNRQSAQKWLVKYGDPYIETIYDESGTLGINWGVYGTPETFVIDRKGIIRYKYIGAVNDKVWSKELLPVVKKLQSEKG